MKNWIKTICLFVLLSLISCSSIPTIELVDVSFTFQEEKTIDLIRSSKSLLPLTPIIGALTDNEHIYLSYACDICNCRNIEDAPGVIEKFNFQDKTSSAHTLLKEGEEILSLKNKSIVGQSVSEIFMLKSSTVKEKHYDLIGYLKSNLNLKRLISLEDEYDKPLTFFYPHFYYLNKEMKIKVLDVSNETTKILELPLHLDHSAVLHKFDLMHWFIIYPASHRNYYIALFNEVTLQMNVIGQFPDLSPYHPVFCSMVGEFVTILWKDQADDLMCNHIFSFYDPKLNLLYANTNRPFKYVFPAFLSLTAEENHIEFGYIDTIISRYFALRFSLEP